ncbi:hypothetical protein CDL15_Pgr012758 [Punica granatum]|nr:hypothetical protein CDL15_Pgr012758 [Punica granatum]PKI74020.1 hypothetical protein CRG98_005637 [Punica granatum]
MARLLRDLARNLEQESSPLNGVREEVGSLHGRLRAIQAVLEDAEEKQLRDQLVKDWLRELRELACDAEDMFDSLITDARLLQHRDHHLVSNLEIPAHVFKAQVTDLLGRLDGIDKRREKLLLSRERVGGGDKGRRPRTDTSHLEHAQFVVGREDDISAVIKLLLTDDPDNGSDDGVSVIPIIGMGGLGKTTLSHKVFEHGAVGERFKSRMWVCVSDDFDLKRILREMIKFHSKMPIDLNISEATLESRILEFLEGKPFLLVLDDVWPEDCGGEWERLKIVLNKGGKGSKVLITSRTEKVSEIMVTHKPYRLGCLPEDKCLSLFNKIAFKGEACFSGLRKELEQIGKRIVQKCKGLPLAVKAMAGLLRDIVDIREWKAILRSEIWEVDETKLDDMGRVRVLPALQLSYYHLPSTLKQCFAYCSIFPKAYVFKREDLVKLWMAEAFLQPGGIDKSPQEVGSEYFDELLMRSFFQFSDMDGKVVYKMHDLIHDMAVSVSKPYCVLVKGTGSSRSSVASRHVSLMCENAEQPLSEVIANSKKLRTLLLPTDYLKNFGQALGMLFHSLPYMRALDLSSSELKQLPDSIAELKLLRYLDLSQTEIQALPNSICRLYNLETLKLLGCRWLFTLPEDLADLVNLCHLELDGMFWFKATSLPPRMGNLTKLQNLHSFIVGQDPGHGIRELSHLACLVGTLHISKLENAWDAAEANLKEKANLQKVVFQWSSTSDREHEEVDHARIFEDLRPHKNVEVLQVSYYKGSAFPSWLRDGVVDNLVSVSLTHCINCKILSLGDLLHLRELNLKGMAELEEWLGEGPSLRRLKLSSCPKLRVLPRMFPSMRVMKIKRCDGLEVLPVTPHLQFLTLDSNSSLKGWQEVQIRFLLPNERGQYVAVHRWSHMNLLEMMVTRCPKLEGLPKKFAPQKLEIHHCELINELPSQEFASRLQHLALVGCNDGTLVRAIPYTASLVSLVISGISNLSIFPEWPPLPGLEALYIHDCQDLESLSAGKGGSLQALASVKLLSVRNCPRLITLAVKGLPLQLECLSISSCPNLRSLGPKGTVTSLTQLKNAYILDCPVLDSLPEDGFPVSVEHLHIENCPLLRDRRDGAEGGGPDWPKINKIPDLVMIDSSPSSTSYQIPNAEILGAFSALRSLFALGPVNPDDPELQSSSFDEAIHVIHALDQSYGLNSHQVEGLHRLEMDWRRIASAASAAKRDQEQLLGHLSAMNHFKTSLLDTVSRHETLKQQGELLERQDEEDQLKIKELKARLERVKAQSAQIKSQRLANFDRAKQLSLQFSQLGREAGQHEKRMTEAGTSLSSAEQQWGAFRDTIVEVTSLFE